MSGPLLVDPSAPAVQGQGVPELSGRQRRHLRGLAHPLRPVVHVGEEGISAGVVEALRQALVDHELVKVRLHEPESKKTLARSLAESSHAALCGLVGHTVILYRPHPASPRIQLPDGGS